MGTRNPLNAITDRDLRKLVRATEKQGAILSRTGGGHIRMKLPGGQVAYTSATPSDFRTTRNLRAELRRKGMEL